MRKTITSTAVALSAAALTVGLAGAAHAEQYGIDDPQDTGHGSDILALQVRNADQNLHVVSFHQNLRKNPATGSGGRIYIDTDAADKGPEYVFVAGFTRGTDFVLLETEGFRPKQWGDPVEQGARFVRDCDVRRARGDVEPPMDAGLLDALAAGLPACAGVALGMDRLLMAMLATPRIAGVLAFDFSRS